MKPGNLVRVTNTLTPLYRRIGLVVDVKHSGDSNYIRILVLCSGGHSWIKRCDLELVR
jgi:hypothetical protein